MRPLLSMVFGGVIIAYPKMIVSHIAIFNITMEDSNEDAFSDLVTNILQFLARDLESYMRNFHPFL